MILQFNSTVNPIQLSELYSHIEYLIISDKQHLQKCLRDNKISNNYCQVIRELENLYEDIEEVYDVLLKKQYRLFGCDKEEINDDIASYDLEEKTYCLSYSKTKELLQKNPILSKLNDPRFSVLSSIIQMNDKQIDKLDDRRLDMFDEQHKIMGIYNKEYEGIYD